MSAENPLFLGMHTWTSRVQPPDLQPGQLVAHDHEPYRVLHIEEVKPGDWDEQTTARWIEAGRPNPGTWYFRPFEILVRHDRQPAAAVLHGIVHAGHTWLRLPEHYPVCNRCGQIPPCQEVRITNEIAKGAERADVVMALEPGQCHHCGRPVTRRHASYTFAGANLIRPDFPDGTAVFHGRKRPCLDAAFRYDQAWADAEPGRTRRFLCEGAETRHADGSLECTAGAACPGAPAHHAGLVRHDPGWAEPGTCWCITATAAASAALPAAGSGPDS